MRFAAGRSGTKNRQRMPAMLLAMTGPSTTRPPGREARSMIKVVASRCGELCALAPDSDRPIRSTFGFRAHPRPAQVLAKAPASPPSDLRRREPGTSSSPKPTALDNRVQGRPARPGLSPIDKALIQPHPVIAARPMPCRSWRAAAWSLQDWRAKLGKPGPGALQLHADLSSRGLTPPRMLGTDRPVLVGVRSSEWEFPGSVTSRPLGSHRKSGREPVRRFVVSSRRQTSRTGTQASREYAFLTFLETTGPVPDRQPGSLGARRPGLVKRIRGARDESIGGRLPG